MDEPIRVLHVFGALNTGGAESRTMDIYRKINKKKVQFDFLIHTKEKGFFEDEIKRMGGRIYRVPRLGIKTLFSYPRSVDNLFQKHSEFKIIHGHMLSTAFIYLKKAKNNNVPIRIAHSRNSNRAQKDVISKIKNITEKLNSFYATHMFAVSKLAGYGTFGRKKVESHDVKVIPNAINSQKYTFNQVKRDKVREDLNLNGELVIGHIGRFSPQKNHLFLLDIFYDIKNKQQNSKLILVGKGPMESQIQDKITQLGLRDSVIMLGVRNDVQDLLQAMDILLFPSTHEGLPGVVLEAQAAGLPSIISDTITEEVQITELVNYLSLNEDVKTWSKEIINVDEETQRKNTYNQIVEAGYDIETVAEWYEDFYISHSNTVY